MRRLYVTLCILHVAALSHFMPILQHLSGTVRQSKRRTTESKRELTTLAPLRFLAIQKPTYVMGCSLSNDNFIIFLAVITSSNIFHHDSISLFDWAFLLNPGSFGVKQHGFILFIFKQRTVIHSVHIFWAVYFQNKVFTLYKQFLDLYHFFFESLVFLKVQLWF